MHILMVKKTPKPFHYPLLSILQLQLSMDITMSISNN